MSFNPLADGAAEALDFITLAGMASPGIAYVEGAGTPRKWDKQQGYGTDGAFLKWTGDDLAEFTVRIECWLSEHFLAWASFRELVKKSPPNVQPKVLDIRHPQLEDCDIHAVVVLDVSQWVLSDDTGKWSVTIKFSVFRAAKPAIAAPKASIDKPDSPDDAKDAVDVQIQNLQNQFSAAQKEANDTP